MGDIAICAQPRELARLSAALTTRGFRVRARGSAAADLGSALTAAPPGGGDGIVAVVAEAARRCLTSELIAQCDRRGIRLVAVAFGSQGRRRAARLGLFEIVDAAEGADALARMIAAPLLETAAEGRRSGPETRDSTVTGGEGGPSPDGSAARGRGSGGRAVSGRLLDGQGRDERDAVAARVMDDMQKGDAPYASDSTPAEVGVHAADGRLGAGDAQAWEPGRIIAVWGPAGAPGRSSLAIGLAAEHARRGRETALCDVDTYGGSIATCLGLLDEAPGFAACCRLAGHDDLTLDELDRLATVATGHRGVLKVLTGITQPSRWPELSEERVSDVLRLAREWAEVTVLDTGFSIEADEELSSDVFAPRRNAATLAALREADQIVLVGLPDPVGLSRLVRAHAELAQLLPQARPIVVVNRVRARTGMLGQAYQVRTALERFSAITDPVLVPEDPRVFGRAMLDGRSLVDAAPRSPVRSALSRLADLTGADPAASTVPAEGPDLAATAGVASGIGDPSRAGRRP